MRHRLKVGIYGLLASGMMACGSKTKDRDDGPRSNYQSPTNDSAEVLKIASQNLLLSLANPLPGTPDTPNEWTAQGTGHRKIEAEFQLKASESYALQLTSIKNQSAGCQNQPPAPEFLWVAKALSKTTSLTMGNPFSAEKGQDYLLKVVFDNAANCKTVRIAFGVSAEQSIDPSKKDPSIKDSTEPKSNDETDRGPMIAKPLIREYGFEGTDTAVLFPIEWWGQNVELKDFEIESIEGPNFLKDPVYGMMDEKVINKLFNKGSRPMGATEKRTLLAIMEGKAFIYVEEYPGRLCNEIQHSIKMKSIIKNIKFNSTLNFVAQPQGDQCVVTQSAGLTSKIH